MADNIIGNMFGVNPDQLRMQRWQQAQQQNMQMAQMDPFQRASASMANAGSGLTMLGAQALGLKTPEERLSESRKQAMSGIDTGKPDSMFDAARKLNEVGDTQGAMMLAQHARGLVREQSALKAQAQQTSLATAREEALAEEKRVPKIIEQPIGNNMIQKYITDAAGNPIEKWGEPYLRSEALKAEKSSEMKPGDELRWMNQHSKDFERASTVIDTSSDANRTVKAIKENPKFGYLFGGYTEKTLSKFAPGEIAGMQSDLTSLKSNLKSTGLNLVKSSNQAGIGSITEKEWPIFESMIANLDQKMDEKTAKAKLGQIENFFERTQKRASEMYEKKWKSKPEFYDPSIKERISNAAPQIQQPQTQGVVRKYNPATGRIE